MRRRFPAAGFCAVVLTTLLIGRSTVHAADASDAVPESAGVVLKLKAPQAALAKLGDFVNEVQPGIGEAIKANTPVLGLAISNPALAGVDVTKDWSVVAFLESRQRPKLVFVIPATDTNAMKNALPPNFQFHAAEKLGLYSDDETALGLVRDRLSGKGSALWSQVDADSKKLFDSADLALFVHTKLLAKSFQTELDQAAPQLDALLTQLSAMSPAAQRQQMEMAMGMYRELGKGAIQGARDSRSLTIGISFSKEAIRIEDRLQVTEGTATAKFLSGQPAGELSLLSRLPADKLAYFGVHVDMSNMIEWSMKMTKGFLFGAADEQKAKFDEAVKQMKGLKFGDMAGYLDLETKMSGGALRAGSVAEVTPANQMRDISRVMLAAMREIQTPGFKQTTTLEQAAEKIGSAEVDRLTMKQEFDPANDPLGIQQKMMNVLYGPDGMKQRVLYQPTRTVQSFGGDLSDLETFAKALDSKSASDTAEVAARKRLTQKANVIGLADFARLMANGIRIAVREKVLPFPLDDSAIEGLGLKPSFIGFSIACEPAAARCQLEVPSVQAQGIARIVMLMMTQARGQR